VVEVWWWSVGRKKREKRNEASLHRVLTGKHGYEFQVMRWSIFFLKGLREELTLLHPRLKSSMSMHILVSVCAGGVALSVAA
jgi:hypothetical protein